MNNKKKGRGIGIGVYLLMFMVIVGTVAAISGMNTEPMLSYSDVIELFEEEQVAAFLTDGTELTMILQDESILVYSLPSILMFREDLGELIEAQRQAGIITDFDYRITQDSVWGLLMPYIILLLIIVAFWFFIMNKQDSGGKSAMNFGKSRARLATDEHKKVTFGDVAGADEEKRDLEEIVEFLKDPRKFTALGARIPKGVLLVGPPGTGKTLIAKAVAGEAGVPFFSISGSDFVELYVGVGASRVRDLFSDAKKNAPAIVFIDEIDAVGRQRGAGLGGGHDEREQTLNQLLVEMDGFGNNAGVIIIAATNRADILDPALLRPGRFDRQITVNYPDVKGRTEILKVHARKKPFDKNVSFEAIARSTVGFTGADLENLLNESALIAARRNRQEIASADIDEAFLKVLMGNEKKSRVVSDDEKRKTAYHEAGHALVTRMLPTQDPIHQVTIIPRGQAGGFTLHRPKDDKMYRYKKQMFDNIVVLLGGRVAEEIVLDDVSTGASNDIKRASDIARQMVTKYGMSDKLGPINFGSSQDEVFLGRDFTTSKNISDGTAALIDSEVKALIDEAYERCHALIKENLHVLERITEALIEHETLDEHQFEAAFLGNPIPERTDLDISRAQSDETKGEKSAEAQEISAPEQQPGEQDETQQDNS